MPALCLLAGPQELMAVFHGLVRRRVQAIFDALSSGDWAHAQKGLADDVHHVFGGDHALGGDRHSRDAVSRWFERLFKLFHLQFDVQQILVSGPLWDLRIAVEWIGYATPKIGESYVNEGAHMIRIHRGRVVYLHAYEDSQKVADACRRMAEAGIAEAGAPPIVD
jgi:ketosteroid isomerase-like protein